MGGALFILGNYRSLARHPNAAQPTTLGGDKEGGKEGGEESRGEKKGGICRGVWE